MADCVLRVRYEGNNSTKFDGKCFCENTRRNYQQVFKLIQVSTTAVEETKSESTGSLVSRCDCEA